MTTYTRAYQCHTCSLPVDPNNCFYRYGRYFCCSECRDAFDERNDTESRREEEIDAKLDREV